MTLIREFNHLFIKWQVFRSDYGFRYVSDTRNDRNIDAMVYFELKKTRISAYNQKSKDYETHIFIFTIGSNPQIFWFSYVWT